jgi:hypothetical protein
MPESFSSLVQLHYAPWGRLPSKEEWDELDQLTSDLFDQLSEPLKKRFARSRVSPFIAYLPMLLMVAACISLLLTVDRLADAQREIVGSGFNKTPEYMAFVDTASSKEKDLKERINKTTDVQEKVGLYRELNHLQSGLTDDIRNGRLAFISNNSAPPAGIPIDSLLTNATIYGSVGTIVLFYLIWLVSMGCIGAVAFIGMNAISAQDDITFDISNMRLMTLRVVLGGLFALVLALPFGSQKFIEFCYFIGTGDRVASPTNDENSFAQVLMLTMPFLLGFSTSLVILILNQAINGVQAFFGVRPGATHELEPTDPQRIGRLTGTGFASTSVAPSGPRPTGTSTLSRPRWRKH